MNFPNVLDWRFRETILGSVLHAAYVSGVILAMLSGCAVAAFMLVTGYDHAELLALALPAGAGVATLGLVLVRVVFEALIVLPRVLLAAAKLSRAARPRHRTAAARDAGEPPMTA